MLSAWIIDQLRRQEEERQRDQPVLELPLYEPQNDRWEREESPVKEERGICIIEL